MRIESIEQDTPQTVQIKSQQPSIRNTGNVGIKVIETPIATKKPEITQCAKNTRPKRGRPATGKKTQGKYIKVYLVYPTEKNIERVRNLAKGINLSDSMRLKRLMKIANTPTEAQEMLLAQGKERQRVERLYRVWVRRRARLEKKQRSRVWVQACKDIARAIKRSKPIRSDDD